MLRPLSTITATARRIAASSLSIVAAIAAAHHGTLDLHARAQGGLRAVITLPAVAQTVMTRLPS